MLYAFSVFLNFSTKKKKKKNRKENTFASKRIAFGIVREVVKFRK